MTTVSSPDPLPSSFKLKVSKFIYLRPHPSSCCPVSSTFAFFQDREVVKKLLTSVLGVTNLQCNAIGALKLGMYNEPQLILAEKELAATTLELWPRCLLFSSNEPAGPRRTVNAKDTYILTTGAAILSFFECSRSRTFKHVPLFTPWTSYRTQIRQSNRYKRASASFNVNILDSRSIDSQHATQATPGCGSCSPHTGTTGSLLASALSNSMSESEGSHRRSVLHLPYQSPHPDGVLRQNLSVVESRQVINLCSVSTVFF
ncbi:hypothetical protein R3P38DRAFT_3070112 [Favolaschia claudopus]|uniref:Uncharacterized protein n=1 Tax=Favolaschia claudopus TaxID=2862362 RepID=A0AAV9ZZZ7_9AGAR